MKIRLISSIRLIRPIARYLRSLGLWAKKRLLAIRRWRSVRHYLAHLRRQRRRYFAWASLAGMALQLLLPLAGLIQPLQANNLIKPTQKGDSLFESVNPGFTAEFGDRGQPTQHKLRFEAQPDPNLRMDPNTPNSDKFGYLDRFKEAVLGAESKGVELRLVELGVSTQAPVEHSLSSEASSLAPESVASTGFGRTGDFSNEKSGSSEKALAPIQSQLQEVESGLKEVETGITAVSKDVAEVTKITKNILEESGVGKPELSVRPSMEETPADFAKSAGYNSYNDYNGYNNYKDRSVPPAELTAPVDTVSQTIDEATKIEYQIVQGRGVKESITLMEKNGQNGQNGQNGYNSYTFELKLDPGVEVRQSIDGLADGDKNYNGYNDYKNYGVIYFVDSFGRYLFHFETPYMIDAAGAKSSAVTLDIKQFNENCNIENSLKIENCKIENSASKYILTLTADNKWLMDAARVYPILIDPTIVHEDNPAFASGTENRSQINSSNAVETQFKELQTDINTVGLWHFNSDSASEQTLFDSSGNTNDLTRGNASTSQSTDPTWSSTGILGSTAYKSIDIDGADDHAYRADDADFDFAAADNFTVEAWVKHDNTTSAAKYILTKADATTGGYKLYMDASGDFCFDIDDDATWTPDDTACTSAIDYDDSAWHHVAGVKYGTTAIKLYVDGKEVATDTSIAATATLANTNALYIGVDRDGTSNEWDGLIDEVAISRVARTPEEIAADASRYPYSVHESPVIDFGSTPNSLDSLTYSATGVQTGDGEKPFSSDGLVAQWNFNETSGTAAYNTAGSDSCGGTPSSCNGTLTSFASTSSQDQAAGTGWTANNRRWGAGALMFDGTNDYVSVTDNNSLDITNAISIEFWINTSKGAGSVDTGIVIKGGWTGSYDIALGGTDGSNDHRMYFYIGSTTITSNKTFNDGVWHHVVAKYDSAEAKMRLFIDGKEDISGDKTGAIPTDVNTLYFGRRADGNANGQFNGMLDSTRIYSRALTAAEILANYQSGNIEFQTRTGATSTPNDGTWEAWKTTSGTGDTQIDAMDATTGWAWDGNASDPTSVALDTTTKAEGTGSLKNIVGMPEADANTVALWHMDETSGTGAYIQDATANNNDGTPTGTTVVDGFYGKGRSFNGTSSDYVEVPDSTSLSVTGTLTIEAWVKSSSSGVRKTVVSKDASGQRSFGFEISTSNTAYFYACQTSDCGTAADAVGNTTISLADGKWHYVAGVFTPSTAMKVYADGVDITATTTSTLTSIYDSTTTLRIGNQPIAPVYFNGSIDEVRISNTARSAEEIAEAYRAGRDHRLTKTLSSTDLSSKVKLPFYVASDRTGTFLEATIGESAYANYEPDANTVGLWHLEEQTGSGAYIKDSSGSGNNGTPTGTTFVQGKIGKARSFNGTSDRIETGNITFPSSGTLGAWFNTTTASSSQIVVAHGTTSAGAVNPTAFIRLTNTGTINYRVNGTTDNDFTVSSYAANQWTQLTMTWTPTTMALYKNGVLIDSRTGLTVDPSSSAVPIRIGRSAGTPSGEYYFNGTIDEVRVSNSARTADEIRQAYEVGKRTHPVTIDFNSQLDASNLITGSADYTFALSSNIKYQSSNINTGEKIIVRENVGGTEYIAQGTVSAITYGAGVSNANAPNQALTNAASTSVTVTSWDSGSTFPTGGFTLMASVFKWQREFMDLSPISLASHRDAITRITLRVTDGSQGATVWLDDFESADYSGGAMTSSNSASIAIGSTAQRYFQYRAILTTRAFTPLDAQLSNGATPALTNVQINYNSGTTPQAPKTKDASSDFTATGASLNRITDTGSSNSPSLELAYKELPKDINTVGLWHMNEASGTSVADSSGNANTGTATGTTVVAGKLGNARSFNGTSDYVDMGAGSSLNLTQQLTVETWVNFSSTSTNRGIYGKGAVGGARHYLYWDSGGTLQFGVNDGASGNNTSYTWTPSTSRWYHIAATYDTNKNVRVYIDGTEVSASTFTVALPSISASSFIGRVPGSAAFLYFAGQIDEVRVSNIARTPEEIKLDAQRRPYGVYTSDVQNLGTNVSSIDNLRWTENGVQTGDGETPYSTNGLVAQWNFNETSGTTAAVTSTSSCGTACNGTLTNFASTSSQDQAAGTGWTKDNRKWGAGAINIASAATADTITVSDPASNTLDPNSSDLTIGMWVKTQDVTAELLSNNANNGTACTANGYYLGIDSSGYPVFYLDTNGITAGCDAQISTGITTKINDGQWHFLNAVITRGTSALLYLDGVQIGSDTSVTSYSSITVTGNIQIGSNANYDGALDAIQVYSRALSASEILSDYQAGNVELQTRTGTTTTPNDGTWEAWKPTTSETMLDAVDSLSPVEKISQTSLTAYWKLDETSGSRADSKGANTLTDNNTVTYAPGRLGNAGQFTAANSEYLSIADNADLSLGTDTDFTLATWVYLDSLPASGANYAIVDKVIQATPTGYRIIVNNSGGTIRFVGNNWNSAGSGCSGNASTLGTPATNTWYLIVFWHDSTADTCSIQVNGGTVDSASWAGGTTDNTAPFTVGANQTPGEFFNGKIDEVAFWKRTLTAAERTRLFEDGLDLHASPPSGGALYRSRDTATKIEGTAAEKLQIGSPQVDASTVGLWHLEETSSGATDIKDSTANANNSSAITGTTTTDGFYGKARSFDGSDDLITIANETQFEALNSISVEAWVKTPTSNPAVSNRIVVGKDDVASQRSWSLMSITDGSYYFFVYGSNSNYSDRYTSSTTLNDGKWHHFVATWTTGSAPNIYVDGVANNGTSTNNATGSILNTTSSVTIGGKNGGGGNHFSGSVDEVRVSNTVRSAEEIAEAYRAGRDHRLTKTITSTDLSAKTKLPFYVASDRPGTYLEATIGESAFANYESDANTVGLWHLEEQTGSGAYIKDSSGSGNNGTPTGTTFVQGKIGKGRSFNGTSDYISCTDAACGGSSKLEPTGSMTLSAWIKTTNTATQMIMSKCLTTDCPYQFLTNASGQVRADLSQAGSDSTYASVIGGVVNDGNWHFVSAVLNGTTSWSVYIDGNLSAISTTFTGTRDVDSSASFRIGAQEYVGSIAYFNGSIDEARFDTVARTADEIRQAYEIGKRTHQITNDFVTTPQAAYSSGTSVTINNPYGTTNLTDTLSIGDTMIFKENVGGTETVSQAVVTAITNTSSVYGTVTLLAAPTFPSGGYTTAATVFKWQREFFDLSSMVHGHRDAVSRITLRVTDGSQGANIWLDDIKSAGPYLSVGTARASTIASTPQQYFQYRVIFTTTDTSVSPTLTSISLQYHSDPQKVTGADTFASGTYDNDGNIQLGSNNVKDVQFYDRTKDQISYALETDGSNDYVDIGTGPTSVKTVEFWVYPETTTEYFINLTSTTDYIWVNAGTVTATGFAAPIIYVDGAVSSTLVADKWQHVAITDTTGENASNLDIGRTADANYLEGKIDEMALYDDVRTPAEVASDYNARRLGTTDANLVALYHFDEGSGTRAYDSDGTAHGTLTNMTDDDWVNSLSDRDQSALSQQVLGVDPNWGNGPVRRSNALSFNGTSDYVSIGNFLFSDALTIETWYNPSTSTGDRYLVFADSDTNHLQGLNVDHTNNYIYYYLYADGTTNYRIWRTSYILTQGAWYHIAVTQTAPNTSPAIYVNGISQTVALYASGGTTSHTTQSLSIGRRGGVDGGYVSGLIDEVAIFSTARTAAQISSDYNARRLKGNETGLVGLWHFDEGEFNTCSGGTNDACDASSSANDGAATGTTWVTDARAVMDNNARYVSLGASSAVNTDRGMEIKITSTTAFQYRWTGDQTWTTPATSTLSSYSFSSPSQIDSTGVYVGFDTTNGTFGDESYFLIPSWALEQFSNSDTQNAMRGAKRGFPERSYLVATDKGVDILNADDNTLWMRLEQGSGRSLGADFNNDPSSVSMVHGQLSIATNGSSATGLYRYDFNRDKIYRYDATDRRTNTVNIAKRNTADSSYGSADTGQNLISSVVNDVFVLTIQGKCVTGDTMLRRRRRKIKNQKSKIKAGGKPNPDDDYIWEDVRIDEIKEGDETLSLNEKTGKFEWQIVEAKKNMGVKDTWQIITESGKKIRATSDHKFLSSVARARSGTFEVDQSNRIEDRVKDTYIAITGHGYTNITVVKSEVKRAVFDKYYKTRQKLFGPMMWARVVNHLLAQSEIQNAKIILDIEYSNYDKLIEQIVTTGVKNISVEFKSIGKESPAHIAVWTANRKARKTTGASGITQTAKDVLHPEFTGIRTSSSRIQKKEYQRLAGKSSSTWTEAANLASNYWIATDAGWEKVKVVYKVAHETVWDIRVSQNHNFVGNGIVAHNCLLAAATDTGVTKISNIFGSDTSYDYSDNASDDYGHVVLAETAGGAGDLYADNDTTDALERWNNVLDDVANETAGTPDTTYDETSTPAIFVTAATEINDLKLTNQTSTVEAASPTIYIAHDLGTTVLNEKRSDPTNGSVKYENVSRITEEMIGDTNGMWSLDDVNDSSVKANNLTNNASVTFTTTGVRGKSAHFTAASSQYLSKADNASLSTGDIDFTIAAWVYLDSKPGYMGIVSKYDNSNSNREYYLVYEGADDRFEIDVSSNGVVTDRIGANTFGSPSIGIWYFIIAWHDSVNNTINISVNNSGVDSKAYSLGVFDGIAAFSIGAASNGIQFWDGRIDEVMFTKEVLSAAQRTQLYVSGREALNNKYRVKLASDTVNQLNGSTNITKAIGVSKLNQTGVTRGEYLYVGTNGSAADDGSLSRILVNGDVRDATYDEANTEPYVVTDNDINSLSVSSDGAYIIVGSDDSGVTIIQSGSSATRMRGGKKTQGGMKRPHN